MSPSKDELLKKVPAASPAAQTLDFGPPGQRFLVTGATGFIGKRLVAALLRGGHEVTVLTRQPGQAAREFDGAVRCVGGMDELDPATRIDIVINLAGARILGWRWTAARRAVLRASRIGLTNKVVDWIARAGHKPRLMLSGSAIGYYGVQPRDDATLLTEDAPPQEIFMSRLCQEWEQAAQKARAHGVQVACMRFGLVMGTAGALPMMLLPVKLGMGGPMGGGKQRMSWIHVEDVLRGMAHLARLSGEGASVAGAWNFTAPEQVSQHEFMRIAAGVAHRPCFMPTPGWPVRLMLGEQADLLLEGQAVTPARLQSSGFAFRYPSTRAALHSLM